MLDDWVCGYCCVGLFVITLSIMVVAVLVHLMVQKLSAVKPKPNAIASRGSTGACNFVTCLVVRVLVFQQRSMPSAPDVSQGMNEAEMLVRVLNLLEQDKKLSSNGRRKSLVRALESLATDAQPSR